MKKKNLKFQQKIRGKTRILSTNHWQNLNFIKGLQNFTNKSWKWYAFHQRIVWKMLISAIFWGRSSTPWSYQKKNPFIKRSQKKTIILSKDHIKNHEFLRKIAEKDANFIKGSQNPLENLEKALQKNYKFHKRITIKA